MGRPTEALRQCSRLTEALDRELSVCSPAEAMALRQDVLDTGLPRPPESSETGELWLPGDDLPLLGRREALARVGRAVEHVRCSGGGTVLVSGETGIGKMAEPFAPDVEELLGPYRAATSALNGKPATWRAERMVSGL